MGRLKFIEYAEQIMDMLTEWNSKEDLLMIKVDMKGMVTMTRVFKNGQEQEINTLKLEPMSAQERTNVLTRCLMILVKKEEHRGPTMCYRLMRGDGPWDYLTYYERDDDDERARQQELPEIDATSTETK